MKHLFTKESRIEAPAAVVFAWHERPDALERLIPPGDPVRVVEHTGGIRDGARVVIEMGYPPLTVRWVALHEGYVAGRQFRDVQVKGPFAFWRHTHSFLEIGPETCLLRDEVEYALPLSPFSEIAAPLVRRKLVSTFAYRHAETKRATSAAGTR